MNKIVFCLPAWNEEKLMAECANKLREYLSSRNWDFSWKIAILVNGSSDQSWNIAQELAHKYPEHIEAHNYSRPSKGGAIKKYWLNSSADILAYMDIDMAVSLDDILPLIEAITKKGADISVGSRLMWSSKTDRSFIRSLTSYAYNILAQIILWQRLPDLQCGFKAVKREVFQDLAPYLGEANWFFDTELLVFGRARKYRIKDVAVDWKEGRYQKRKTKVRLWHDSWKFIKDLITLKKKLKKNPV